MNTKLPKLCEGCGCDQQDKTNKIKEKIKAKYLGNTAPQGKPDLYITEYVNDIFDLNLNKLIGKKALIESDEGIFFGTFGQFKGNCALYEGEFLKKVVYNESVVKIICENVKIIIDKPELKRKHPHTIVKNSDGKLIHENASMLLCDRLKTRFFGSITEEVVNKDNEFSMTKAEISDRDRRADAMLRSKKFNPKLKNGDTREEAAHRIATDQVINARSGNGHQGKDLFTSQDNYSSLSRRKRKGIQRQRHAGPAHEKREEEITKRSKTGGNRKTVARNREEADEQTRRKKRVTSRRTVANIPGTEGATNTQGKAARERGDAKTAYAATNRGLFR
jgi:hypothetical protein